VLACPGGRQEALIGRGVSYEGEHGRHLRNGAMAGGYKRRHAPKRIDCQILGVRLLAAFDAHGLVRQPARLECYVRCQRAIRPDSRASWGGLCLRSCGADLTFDACGIFIE